MARKGKVEVLRADTLYVGDGSVRHNATVSIADGRITAIGEFDPQSPLPAGVLHAEIAAPGFIDLQINGAKDRQFNDLPDVDTVAAIAEGARAGGTAHVLPTFITAEGQSYLSAMRAAERARDEGVAGILGLHLEGPFLNPERSGIHEPSVMRPVNPRDLEAFREFRGGKLLVTLAPECQSAGIIRQMAQLGVTVFAGHSAANAPAIAAAATEGLTGATHLFNAMSQMTGREPGVVGAVLSSRGLFAGIIADGHHVAWENIVIASRLMPDRLCLVTDAMRTLEGLEREFDLDGRLIRLEGGRLTDSTGRLAGAHVSLEASVRNLVSHAGVELGVALQMASANPARALGLDAELGMIAEGFRASVTLLDKDLYSKCVMVDGRVFQKPSELSESRDFPRPA